MHLPRASTGTVPASETAKGPHDMATLTGPLLSFGARKSIGKTLVYSSWKGIPYSRQHVIPANPNTADQQDVRGVFRWLQQVFAYSAAEVQESWNAYASGQPLTGRNAIAKFNVANLQGEVDLANFIMAPAAKSGPVAAGISVAPGATQLAVTLTAPTLPSGWAIVQGVAGAILDQNPQSGTNYSILAAVDAATPFVPTITGLQAASDYIVGGWFKYTRPDGSFAYGPAMMTTGTTP